MIFGTNLNPEPSASFCFFPLFQCFAEKEYQTESKRNETSEKLFLERKQYRRLGVHVRGVSGLSTRQGPMPGGGGRALHPRGQLGTLLVHL